MNRSHHIHSPRRGPVRGWLAAGSVATAAVLTLAACGTKATTGGGASSSPSSSASSSPTAAAAPVTIATANVPGVGSVLVNGDGLTLYILSSEAGGKITCTDDNGCTKVWPDTELPAGVNAGIAGAGVQASLLSTVKSPDGKLYVTYKTFPLYTFTGDTAAGTAAGQGITSFGGTWSSIKPDGTPASAAGAASPTSTASAAAATVQTGSATVSGKAETVLTDASGKTLYYRTTDTATTASCTGACAGVWPPLTGTPTGSSSVTGKLTVVASANGSQVLYNGHFLYRFAQDTAAGQAKGEGVGGFHVATTGLAAAAAVAPAPAVSTMPPHTSSPSPVPSSGYSY